jgi:hypothetical protein
MQHFLPSCMLQLRCSEVCGLLPDRQSSIFDLAKPIICVAPAAAPVADTDLATDSRALPPRLKKLGPTTCVRLVCKARSLRHRQSHLHRHSRHAHSFVCLFCFVCLFVCFFVCLFVCLYVCLFVCILACSLSGSLSGPGPLSPLSLPLIIYWYLFCHRNI